MSQPARFERIDGVGVVTLDNPPVNALSLELRTAIRDAFQQGLDDSAVEAFVLTGGGRMFSAGADITEFDSGRSNEPPTLRDLIDLIEDSPKPVVAAMHGNAMGGGLRAPARVPRPRGRGRDARRAPRGQHRASCPGPAERSAFPAWSA